MLAALADASDRLVTPSAWQADVLVRNGVSAERIRVCRQGVSGAYGSRRSRTGEEAARPALRVGYVGRYDEVKGVHVLVDAVLHLADAPIELHLWGVARTAAARTYREAIKRQAEGHPAIVMHAEVDATAVYPQIDVLAVPSLGFETGPLVVLEAQASGVPVVGSDLGGIAERVQHGVDGLLVRPGDSRALAAALRSFIDDPDSLERLRPRQVVRTMKDVAVDTLQAYREIRGMIPA
jgi:glycosyltransferase involved in cell wall biosynthesis